MNDAPETRCLDLDASEIRMETDPDGRRVITGVAIRYGSLSKPMRDAKGRAFRERFLPGVFTAALARGADVRFLVNHNRDLVLGRNLSSTLELKDDDDALRYRDYPPATAIGEHYSAVVDRRDMTGVSFRFYAIKDRWSGEGDAVVREVAEADIDDVSIVTYPAYDDTTAATRSYEDALAVAVAVASTTTTAPRDPWLDRAWARLRLSAARR
jgi:Escherichia/Staphylococcus phage prohead protease